MKVNKKEFLDKLSKAKPGLSSSDIIEGSDSFFFTKKEILTFNDEICNRVKFESDFEGTIKADPFFKIIQKMKADEDGDLSLEVEDSNGNNLIIKQKRAKASISIGNEFHIDEFGEFPDIKEFKKLPKNFIEAISMSSFCASTDASAPILSCICIKDKEIKSTDSFRVFSHTLDKKMDSFLIPASNISTLKNYNVNKYCLTNSWTHFISKEGDNMSIRSYPPHEYPLDKLDTIFDVKGIKYIFPDSIQDILDKAIIFCDNVIELDKQVNIKIKGKKITVSSKSQWGWFEESTLSKTKVKDDIEFETNPNFLKQILNKYDDCLIDKKGKIMFSSDDWKYVFSIRVL